MNILTIIVTYNGLKWMKRCLDSIASSSVSIDAYIIDNGSNDGTQEFIKNNYPQYLLKQNDNNAGFGAANNIGLNYAVEHGYDYVYLLNQDAWVESNTIETLIKINQKYPQYGILSPLQTNAEGNKLDDGFAYYAPTKDNTLVSDALIGQLNEVYPVDFIMAAHWLISKECLTKVGGFSPLFYHYGEDNDYINRVKYHDFKVGIVTSVKAIHDRERRKLSQRTELFILKAKFLHTVLNPNTSLFKTYFKSHFSLIYDGTNMLFKHKNMKIIGTLFTLSFTSPKIIIARRKIKKTKGIYLYFKVFKLLD
ncbi:MAG: glycosyltransferase family 2 protein [Rikenellaceae bacterium]